MLKINTNTPKNPLSGSGAATRTEQAAGAASARSGKAQSGKNNNVDISSAALQLSNLHSGENDVNIDRVNEIRSALEAGTLKIDTSRIADGLIASARELLK